MWKKLKKYQSTRCKRKRAEKVNNTTVGQALHRCRPIVNNDLPLFLKNPSGSADSNKSTCLRGPIATYLRRYVLVPTLIAMATFMATLKHTRQFGFAIVKDHLAFKIIIICNTISMCSSIVVILSSILKLFDPVKLKLHEMFWASRLIVLAGFMMVMSMVTTIYLTMPASRWLA